MGSTSQLTPGTQASNQNRQRREVILGSTGSRSGSQQNQSGTCQTTGQTTNHHVGALLLPPQFKANYIEQVMQLDNGFRKTVEKVLCPRSHIVEHMFTYPSISILMEMLKCMCSNAYAKMHIYKDIQTKTYLQIETSKLSVPLVSGANNVLRILASENGDCSRSFTSTATTLY